MVESLKKKGYIAALINDTVSTFVGSRNEKKTTVKLLNLTYSEITVCYINPINWRFKSTVTHFISSSSSYKKINVWRGIEQSFVASVAEILKNIYQLVVSHQNNSSMVAALNLCINKTVIAFTTFESNTFLKRLHLNNLRNNYNTKSANVNCINS